MIRGGVLAALLISCSSTPEPREGHSDRGPCAPLVSPRGALAISDVRAPWLSPPSLAHALLSRRTGKASLCARPSSEVSGRVQLAVRDVGCLLVDVELRTSQDAATLTWLNDKPCRDEPTWDDELLPPEPVDDGSFTFEFDRRMSMKAERVADRTCIVVPEKHDLGACLTSYVAFDGDADDASIAFHRAVAHSEWRLCSTSPPRVYAEDSCGDARRVHVKAQEQQPSD